MPKAFTEHEKELISTRLLEQGDKIFSVYGLKKTNVEEIARAVGISKGAFYNFYPSKEALFMDIIEEVEKRTRKGILAAIDLPGPSPRARLFAVLKYAVAQFKSVPILKFLTGSDFDLLFRRVSAEKLQEHLASDRLFFDELVARCQSAGIPIRAHTDQIAALLYPLVQSFLQVDDSGQFQLGGTIDMHLELIAAFSLGEVELQLQKPASPAPDQ